MTHAARYRRHAAGLVAVLLLVALLDVNSIPRAGNAAGWLGLVSSELLIPADAMRDQLPDRVETAA